VTVLHKVGEQNCVT